MKHPPIGIDLGTSTSEICAYIDGKPTPIVDPATKSPVIPSVVALSRTGEVLVGQLALERGLPETIVRESKRGTGLGNRYQLGQKVMTSEEIAALILGKLKSMATAQLGQAITDVVITVPANYEDTRRRAVKEAAAMAGLNVLRLINEPTAAAMAFGFKEVGAEEHLLVYDFGGGTLDVTILEMLEGVLDVKTSSGVPELGGKDIDQRIIDWATAKFQTSNPGAQIDPTALTIERLKRASEAAKRELSEAQSASVFVANYGTRADNVVDLDATLARAEFEGLVRPLVDQSLRAIDAALTKGNYQKSTITRLLLVGGTCYVPCVRQTVEQYMCKPIVAGIDADVAVAAGACINAALYTGDIDTSDPKAIIMQDVSTHGLGTLTYMEVGNRSELRYDEMLPPNTPIPYSVTRDGYWLLRTDQDSLDVELVQDPTGRAVAPDDTIPVPGASGQICNIPPATSGTPHQVCMTFSIDASGIASLTSRLPATGQELTVSNRAHITGSSTSTPATPATPRWEDSPLAAMHRPVIDRAEEALRARPHNAAAMARALAELKQKLAMGDRNGAQAAREALLELLIEL